MLRAIEKRGRRPLPSGLSRPGGNPEGPLAATMPEVPWLQPIPDALLRPESADPASVAASRANIRLALIAALQYLPARQRAVLILRDVLGWRAAEVAKLLGSTTGAANGVLQRARAQLQQVAPAEDEIREPADPRDRELLMGGSRGSSSSATPACSPRSASRRRYPLLPPRPCHAGDPGGARAASHSGRYRCKPARASWTQNREPATYSRRGNKPAAGQSSSAAGRVNISRMSSSLARVDSPKPVRLPGGAER